MFAYEWSDLAQGKKSLYIFSYWLKTVLEFAKIEHLMYRPVRHCFLIRDRIVLGRPELKSWPHTCLL